MRTGSTFSDLQACWYLTNYLEMSPWARFRHVIPVYSSITFADRSRVGAMCARFIVSLPRTSCLAFSSCLWDQRRTESRFTPEAWAFSIHRLQVNGYSVMLKAVHSIRHCLVAAGFLLSHIPLMAIELSRVPSFPSSQQGPSVNCKTLDSSQMP